MKRLVLVLVCLAVAAAVAPGASAAPCYAKITTYYGHYAIDGSTFCYWGGGPPQTPEVIGETTRDCNGQLSSWGNTSCEMYPPTVEYIDCGCNSANETKDEVNPAECAVERATE